METKQVVGALVGLADGKVERKVFKAPPGRRLHPGDGGRRWNADAPSSGCLSAIAGSES